MAGKYRLYVDESGTHGYSTDTSTIKQRYLALTGIAISEEENLTVLQPRMIELKRILVDDPDDLPVLHREDIVNKSGVFSRLDDQKIEEQFNDAYLSLLTDLDYVICSIVLDKKSHFDRYQTAAQHPYHYCMDLLLERYVFLLEEVGGRGDVLAEARGKEEDRPLMERYAQFYENGTYFCRPGRIQQFLTSKEIKIKPKSKMIVGLEFADLLSLATKLTLLLYGVIPPLTDNFNKIVTDTIQPKYRTSATDVVRGFGKKLIT